MIKGIIAGQFDLLHAGSILALRDCKDYCDHLTVALHIDASKQREGKAKPVQSVLERFIQLKACKFVDDIIPYETEEDLTTILLNWDFGVRFLGSDYLERKDITAEGAVPIKYLSRLHHYSSTELKERIKKQK